MMRYFSDLVMSGMSQEDAIKRITAETPEHQRKWVFCEPGVLHKFSHALGCCENCGLEVT